jgi:ATP-dependent Clp protease ATP-binding subunit ClpX
MPAIHRIVSRISLKTPLISTFSRRFSITSAVSRDTQFYRRTDISTHGYTAPIDPSPPVVGPLSQSSNIGAPRLTPTLLKGHLDKFVVGQDKAKKVTSVAIYNHYQRVRELRRQEAEEIERYAVKERRLLRDRERFSHPVESMSNPRLTHLSYTTRTGLDARSVSKAMEG